jgi:ATP-dependent Zn protease
MIYINMSLLLKVVSKLQITFKDQARADEKSQHISEYVSILKRLATHLL